MSAFAQAPFLHVHMEESDHPAAPLAHLHVPKCHDSPEPTIAAHSADDDAVVIEWRIAPPPTLTGTLDLPVWAAAVFEPPSVIAFVTDAPQPRGHDPPALSTRQPRSPPV